MKLLVATPPAVLVRDASNNPVVGFSVTFTLTASGGTGGSINSGSPAVVVTNRSKPGDRVYFVQDYPGSTNNLAGGIGAVQIFAMVYRVATAAAEAVTRSGWRNGRRASLRC